MFSSVWCWLFIANRIIAGTCPRTSSLGSILGLLNMAATFVFIILSFIFAEHWYYGLILCAIYFILPVFLPRIDTNNMSIGEEAWSMIGSHIAPLIYVAIYICFFLGI